jgi:hypothetical protein
MTSQKQANKTQEWQASKQKHDKPKAKRANTTMQVSKTSMIDKPTQA